MFDSCVVEFGSVSLQCIEHLNGLIPGQTNPPNRKKPGTDLWFSGSECWIRIMIS